MRLRTDNWHYAGWKRAHTLKGELIHGDPDYINTPIAEEGDVWRAGAFTTSPPNAFGGYALTCPRHDCKQGVHVWWHAFDCPAGKPPSNSCKQGEGRESCWEWTGSPEEGNLSASPSLYVMEDKGGCGFHGFLKNGKLA